MPATTRLVHQQQRSPWASCGRPREPLLGLGSRRSSGSGPSLPTTASTCAGSSTSHAVGPRRSATIVLGEQAHAHLADRLGRGRVEGVALLLGLRHAQPGAAWGADRGEGILARGVEHHGSGFGPSRNVPFWLVCPMRPFADAIVASIRMSPAKSHAPYMPRCTRSHTSPSNPRNICLPTARASVIRRPSISAAPPRTGPAGRRALPTSRRVKTGRIRSTRHDTGRPMARTRPPPARRAAARPRAAEKRPPRGRSAAARARGPGGTVQPARFLPAVS